MAEMTYKQLQEAIAAVRQDVLEAAVAIQGRAQQIQAEADDTANLAEQISARSVDTDTISETRELAKIMAGLSKAVIEYAAAGNTTAKTAQAAGEQVKESHGGIHEAVNRSNVNGIHNVDRAWFAQE